MKQGWLSALAILIILSMVVVGCSSGKKGDSDNPKGSKDPANVSGELNVMFMEQSAEAALKKLADAFTEQNPSITVKFQFTPNSQYKGIIRPQLLSGEGPDLFMVYNDLGSFAEDLGQREWVDRLIPSVKEGATIQGKLVQLPMTAAGYAVFYNQDIFEELQLKVPTTYEEFLALCEQIKGAGITPLALGLKDGFVPNSAITQFLTAFYSNMPDQYYEKLWSGEAKISENKDFQAGIEKVLELHEKGYFSPGVLSEGYEAIYQEVASGKSAMIIQGTWLPGFTSEMNADLKLGSFILPNPAGGEPVVELYPDWNLGINKNSKNKEAAGMFIDFIAQKENIAALDTEWQSVSAFTDVEVDLGEAMKGYLEGKSKYKVYQPWYPNVADPNYEFVKVLTDMMSDKTDLTQGMKLYDNILQQNKNSLDALYKQ